MTFGTGWPSTSVTRMFDGGREEDVKFLQLQNRLGLFGQPDHAEPTLPELLEQPIAVDDHRAPFALRVVDRNSACRVGRMLVGRMLFAHRGATVIWRQRPRAGTAVSPL
jgi:hypothetical protein